MALETQSPVRGRGTPGRSERGRSTTPRMPPRAAKSLNQLSRAVLSQHAATPHRRGRSRRWRHSLLRGATMSRATPMVKSRRTSHVCSGFRPSGADETRLDSTEIGAHSRRANSELLDRSAHRRARPRRRDSRRCQRCGGRIGCFRRLGSQARPIPRGRRSSCGGRHDEYSA
jgi:hypothetical protein